MRFLAQERPDSGFAIRAPRNDEKGKISFAIKAIWLVQSSSKKYSPSRFTQITCISQPSRPPKGADRDRHERGAGCGGRGSVGRAMGSQGGPMRPVSDQRRADE